jgi:preprotein translocase subunit SecB
VPPVNFDALLEQAIAQQAQEGSANDSGAALN